MDGDATTAGGREPTLDPRHGEWLEARGISAELAAKFGLRTAVQSFQNDQGEWERAKCIAVPYVQRGKVVNHKYRRVEPKQHVMDKGARRCFWNHDVLLEKSSHPLVITEGEWDGLIVSDLGWRAVSVPNGTPEKASADPANEKRYEYLWDARRELLDVTRFIIAVDGDTAGIALRADLIALLGPGNCSFVEYPEGCKDLTDVLLKHGLEAVNACLLHAKPVPVQGLYRISDFPEMPEVVGLETGVDALEGKMQIVPGTVTIFTGYSNMGKSTVLNTILAHTLHQGVPCCVASFETQVRPILIDGIAKAMLGCSSWEFAQHPNRQQAYKRIDSHLTLISNALDEDLDFDIDTFLETARVSVMRDGVRLIVIDPWNELEHKRQRDETMTEYVGRAIRRVKAFARRHNVAFWIVAHPTKPARGVNQMPSLYDVSDSANWANKADYGLVYHRPDKTVNEAQLAVVKVRMGLPGECAVEMVKFDHRVSRITRCDA